MKLGSPESLERVGGGGRKDSSCFPLSQIGGQSRDSSSSPVCYLFTSTKLLISHNGLVNVGKKKDKIH